MNSKLFLRMSASALAIVAAAAFSSAATAKVLHPLGPFHRTSAPGHKFVNPKGANPWTNLKQHFPGPTGPSALMLLTDGTVMVHSWCSSTWWRLSPDNKANYANGTWKQAASMQSSYKPFFFASQVLPDGRMIVNGGEYNASSEGNCGGGAWTPMGSLYDPVADKWTPVDPPSGWTHIGDAQSVILADGSYMLANALTTQEAIATVKGTKVTWTATGTGKADRHDEEGWTLLPNNNILTVDATRRNTAFSFSEIYDAKHGTWSTGANTATALVDPGSSELGPGALRPDGTVLYLGGLPTNNVYDFNNNTWSDVGPLPISGFDVADGPAVTLPTGNVLIEASPGVFNPPAHFFEWDGSKFHQVTDPDDAENSTSFEGRFLVLPTGQILYSADGQSPTQPILSVYTPSGKVNGDWRPKISSVATSLSAGSANNVISGKNFNGFTEGAYYGDDAQGATNWPTLMIKNNATGNVCFARTHDFSTMGVFNTTKMKAKFDIPNSCETGASTLTVSVNGISSKGKSVSID
jgi:hypothetical protein